MFPRPVSYLTLQFLWGRPGRIPCLAVMLLCSFAFCVAQAQAYGFENGQNPPIQQAPPAQTEPNKPAQLFLPLIVGGASRLDHDERPSQPLMSVTDAADHTGDADTPPPEGNRHTFVTDSDGHLDGYWFRNDLPAH